MIWQVDNRAKGEKLAMSAKPVARQRYIGSVCEKPETVSKVATREQRDKDVSVRARFAGFERGRPGQTVISKMICPLQLSFVSRRRALRFDERESMRKQGPRGARRGGNRGGGWNDSLAEKSLFSAAPNRKGFTAVREPASRVTKLFSKEAFHAPCSQTRYLILLFCIRQRRPRCAPVVRADAGNGGEALSIFRFLRSVYPKTKRVHRERLFFRPFSPPFPSLSSLFHPLFPLPD